MPTLLRGSSSDHLDRPLGTLVGTKAGAIKRAVINNAPASRNRTLSSFTGLQGFITRNTIDTQTVHLGSFITRRLTRNAPLGSPVGVGPSLWNF